MLISEQAQCSVTAASTVVVTGVVTSAISIAALVMSNRVKVVCRIRPSLDPTTSEPVVDEDCISIYHRESTGEDADRVKFSDGSIHWADKIYEPLCTQAQVRAKYAKNVKDFYKQHIRLTSFYCIFYACLSSNVERQTTNPFSLSLFRSFYFFQDI